MKGRVAKIALICLFIAIPVYFIMRKSINSSTVAAETFALKAIQINAYRLPWELMTVVALDSFRIKAFEGVKTCAIDDSLLANNIQKLLHQTQRSDQHPLSFCQDFRFWGEITNGVSSLGFGVVSSKKYIRVSQVCYSLDLELLNAIDHICP